MLELFVKAPEGDEHLLLADSNIDDADVNRFKLIIQELLTDKVVLKKIKAVLYPKALMDGMDYFKSKIDELSESLYQQKMYRLQI